MFQWLRKMILPIIIFALATFVGMIILQWGLDISGGGGQQGATGNFAAKINGEEVPWTVYNQNYQNLYRQESNNSEIELADDRLRQIEVQAWNQLLQEILLAQEAEKLNLNVSEDEIYQFLRYSPPPYLQTIPQFMTDGQFDYQKYFSTMLDETAAPFWASVEPAVIADIKKMKLQQSVIQAAHISEDEIRQSFVNSEEKVTVEMINVATDEFNKEPAEVSDEELHTYYDTHADEYTVDERVVLEYVKANTNPSDDDWERARIRSARVYDSLTNGADFAEMATLYSEDVTATRGGDLGWFEKGRMVRAFNDLAFSMAEGDFSEPFKTTFGWHIIKHFGYRTTSKIPAGGTKKQDVREAKCSHILIKVVASTETKDAAYETLASFARRAEESGFAKAAEALDLDVVTTPPFVKQAAIQGIGRIASLTNYAFANSVGTVSDVTEGANAYYVTNIIEKLEAGTYNYDEILPKLKVDLRNQVYRQMCRDTAQAVYDLILGGMSLEKAAKEKEVRFLKPTAFARNTLVRGIGSSPVAIGTAFSLKEAGEISKPVEHANGSVIFKLLSRTSPDLTTFTEIKDSLRTNALFQKQQELYNKWFKAVIDNAEIENNVTNLGETS